MFTNLNGQFNIKKYKLKSSFAHPQAKFDIFFSFEGLEELKHVLSL